MNRHNDETFLKKQEKINMELLKEKGIEPTGYQHYDEQISTSKWRTTSKISY